MYIMDTRRINKRIKELFIKRQISIALGNAISIPVSDGIVFDAPQQLEKTAKEFQEKMKGYGFIYSYDEALMGSTIFTLLGEARLSDKIPPAIIDKIIRNSKVFREGCFDDNPYYKNIKFEEQVVGSCKLTHADYSKYELLMYDTPLVTDDGIGIPKLAVFDHKFVFPSIKEDGATWMSITPNEIFTMEKPIDEASGRVLTLGCGMGYFAYMAALKENVSKVTIVEKNREVIELFETYILPQFSVKDKIELIEADAFEYMKELTDGKYDYCFADIWIGNNDTIAYLKLKKICKKYEKMKMAYWIEDSLVESIMCFVVIEIMKEYYRNQKIKAPEMIPLPPEEQYKYDAIKEILKDVKITNPQQLDFYMKYQNIIDLL